MSNNNNINYIRIDENSSENEENRTLNAATSHRVLTKPLLSQSQNDFGSTSSVVQNDGVASGGDATFALSSSPPANLVVDEESAHLTSNIIRTMDKTQAEIDDSSIVEEDLTHEVDFKKPTLCHRLRGIIAIFLSTTLTSLNNQIFYYLYVDLKIPYTKSFFFAWTFLIYTAQNCIPLFLFMECSSVKLFKPLNDNKKLWYLLTLRGIIGSLVQFVSSHAIDYFGKPAPVSVIVAMAPIFVYIIAYFVLREKIGLIPILNVFVAVAGVIVMNLNDLMGNRPNSRALEGTGIAFAAMLLISTVTIVVRLLRMFHPVIINMAFGVVGVLVHGTIALFENKGVYVIEDRVVLGLCVCSATIFTVSNYLYCIALRYESAGMVSLIRTSDVILNFLFQFLLFNIEPDLNTALGGALVLFGVLCITLRKIVSESSEGAKLRRYFWFLLY